MVVTRSGCTRNKGRVAVSGSSRPASADSGGLARCPPGSNKHPPQPTHPPSGQARLHDASQDAFLLGGGRRPWVRYWQHYQHADAMTHRRDHEGSKQVRGALLPTTVDS